MLGHGVLAREEAFVLKSFEKGAGSGALSHASNVGCPASREHDKDDTAQKVLTTAPFAGWLEKMEVQCPVRNPRLVDAASRVV